MQLVGFSQAKRHDLAHYHTAKTPVKITNCTIQPPFTGEGRLEISVGDNTTIEDSTRAFDINKFQIEETPSEDIPELTLNKLAQTTPYQHISTIVKCLKLLDTLVLDNTCHIQNVLIADPTGNTTIALWEAHIGSLVPGNSYHLHNVMVKHFGNKYTLTTPRHGMFIDNIHDIPDTPSTSSSSDTKQITLHNAQVIAVSGLTQRRSCIMCKRGQIESMPDRPTLGKCSDCPMLTLISKCTTDTTAMLTVEADLKQYELTATGKELAIISKEPEDNITDVALLTSDTFDPHIENMTIANVTPCKTNI